MFCPFCGQQIPDQSEFCPMCGKALTQIKATRSTDTDNRAPAQEAPDRIVELKPAVETSYQAPAQEMPRPAVIQNDKPVSNSASLDEIAVSGAVITVPEGESGTVINEAVPFPKESEAQSWGMFFGAVLLSIIGIIVLEVFDYFFFIFGAIWPCTVAMPFFVMTATHLKVTTNKTRNGDTAVVCSFKKKSNKSYAIAVDGVWVRDQVNSGFTFIIKGTGEHHVQLVANRKDCKDYQKITL